MRRLVRVISLIALSCIAVGCQAKVPPDARTAIDMFISAAARTDTAQLRQSADSSAVVHALELMTDREMLAAFQSPSVIREAWRRGDTLWVKTSPDTSNFPLINLIIGRKDNRWVIRSVGVEVSHATS